MKTYKQINKELILLNKKLNNKLLELLQTKEENLPNLFDHAKINEKLELAISGLGAIKEMTKQQHTEPAYIIATECLLQIEAIK